LDAGFLLKKPLKIQKVRLNSIKGGEKEEFFYWPVVLLLL